MPGALAPVVALDGYGLHLREWADDDVPAMVTLFDETEVDRWTPLRRPFDHAEARAYLDRARVHRAEGRGIQLAITTDARTPRGEILLFRAGLDESVPERPDAELAYAIGSAHRGQGLATRAVRLITEYAYRELGVRHVLLRIDPANLASVAVARATGFELTGAPPFTRAHSGPLHTWCHNADLPTT
ncbi:GNAT family N-acetyltransferase [Nocardia tenerifensis]|nr:GNAT family N-acetyltransferase [Nocardia tenerifensis]